MPPAAIVRGWQQWSRLEILVFGAVCIHKEARRRGIHVAARVTSEWLALFLEEPARSCRHALRELARRGVIRREEGHRWAPTPWNELACAGHPTGRLAASIRPTGAFGPLAVVFASRAASASGTRLESGKSTVLRFCTLAPLASEKTNSTL